MVILKTAHEAISFLISIDASDRLISHARLVGEAGEQLLKVLSDLDVEVDRNFVLTGIALHDVGKVRHPEELEQSGSRHEAAGEALLLESGISPDLARCCRSHAQFDEMDVSFQELLIALSDKLWKGKRVPELELRVIDNVALRLAADRWDVFSDLDAGFEEIAAKGDERLSRSLT